MSIKDLAAKVAPFAPLLATAVGGPAGAAITAVTLIARAFGLAPDAPPADVAAAIAADPAAAAKLTELQETNRGALERLLLKEETKRQQIVNDTARIELQSDDPFVRRARPFFTWSMGVAWNVQVYCLMGLLIFVVVWRPEQAALMFNAVADVLAELANMWMVALAVTGVGVIARSVDKGGNPLRGLSGRLAGLVPGSKK
jgi:hypothetical protein